MIQVKICGITNKNEIEYINILKPEYIGFVFTKSKRQVTAEIAKELYSQLKREIKTVGVFKNNSVNEILDVFKEIPLDVIQLHGKENENFISTLRMNISESTRIWKALSISNAEDIKKYTKDKNSQLIDKFLIDGEIPGSGETFSLENISKLLEEECRLGCIDGFDCNQYNYFLAGGITPENVLERVMDGRPIGIDVSSGVEIIDQNGTRTKSFEKMKSLIEKVRAITIDNSKL